jgi:5-methylcytosine-specific restriction endonuclease McrA
MSIALDYVRVSDNLRVKRGCGKEKVREEDHCRFCLRPARIRSLTRHHLVPRSYFNNFGYKYLRDSDANLIPLCREDHDLIHDPIMGGMARTMLRKLLTQGEIAFMIQVRGIDWTNSTYPLSAGSD